MSRAKRLRAGEYWTRRPFGYAYRGARVKMWTHRKERRDADRELKKELQIVPEKEWVQCWIDFSK